MRGFPNSGEGAGKASGAAGDGDLQALDHGWNRSEGRALPLMPFEPLFNYQL